MTINCEEGLGRWERVFFRRRIWDQRSDHDQVEMVVGSSVGGGLFGVECTKNASSCSRTCHKNWDSLCRMAWEWDTGRLTTTMRKRLAEEEEEARLSSSRSDDGRACACRRESSASAWPWLLLIN